VQVSIVHLTDCEDLDFDCPGLVLACCVQQTTYYQEHVATFEGKCLQDVGCNQLSRCSGPLWAHKGKHCTILGQQSCSHSFKPLQVYMQHSMMQPCVGVASRGCSGYWEPIVHVRMVKPSIFSLHGFCVFGRATKSQRGLSPGARLRDG
jgi:hypothetical protein